MRERHVHGEGCDKGRADLVEHDLEIGAGDPASEREGEWRSAAAIKQNSGIRPDDDIVSRGGEAVGPPLGHGEVIVIFRPDGSVVQAHDIGVRGRGAALDFAAEEREKRIRRKNLVAVPGDDAEGIQRRPLVVHRDRGGGIRLAGGRGNEQGAPGGGAGLDPQKIG